MDERRRPLKVGLSLPFAEGDLNRETPRWLDILAVARRAEEIGFDSLWVPDHLLFRNEGEESFGAWECWSLLAALAAATSRVELGPIVTCTSFRNPALLAKMADTVDEISGGRLILGLGAGWHEPEYRAFGFPYDHRVSRFEEALKIIHGLLRDGAVDFEGTYYRARECELRPRGPRRSGPPILFGTTGERMLRLTAQYGDLWNAWFSRTGNRVEGLDPLRHAVDGACLAAGRDPATLARTVSVLVETAPHGGTLTDWQQPPVKGPAAQVAEELRAYGRAGISHVQVLIMPSTVAGIEAFAPVLEELDRG